MAPTLYATKMRGLELLSSLETKPEDSEFVRNLKIGKINCDEKCKIFITKDSYIAALQLQKIAILLHFNYKR
jgi:hypothetical protein